MADPVQFEGEAASNSMRRTIAAMEPLAMRTFTPSQAVLARSAGVFHWTPEGRRLYDFTSGVLVSNLGHNPTRWLRRFAEYLGWTAAHFQASGPAYLPALAMTAYNAVTSVEASAVERLLANVRRSPGSSRLDSVLWAASGSEAVHKAIWTCLVRDRSKDVILATRYGFHGKKGLANAVTGSEVDVERDPRVRFLSFPMNEIREAGYDPAAVDLSFYRQELEQIAAECGDRISCLITEPYLGGGGSYHPPAAYHQLLQEFCRKRGAMFIFDEVQANFGRTGAMYAFESYGVEPDFVVLGKGLGNGVPVAAAVGRSDVMSQMKYGEASDTWSANPLSCSAVLATLDEFESTDVLSHARTISPIILAGLRRLKETGLIAHVRGEGMVFGIECAAVGDFTPQQVAAEIVKACYLGVGSGGDGIHLLGALAGKVLRVSPPLTITHEEATRSLALLYEIVGQLSERLGAGQLMA